MRAFIRLITCCFYFFASGHLAGADLTDRVNQTVQLGNAFGVEVDSTIAFDQLETLSPDVFRAQFQTFADLNPSTVEDYTETFPEEFWALNQYLSQLYRRGFITPDTLSDLRAASVQGLANYQSTIAPEDFEPQTVTSQTATPELNRFVEIARQIQSGESVAEIARDSTEGAIEQRVRDEGQEQLSFLFPNAKLETRIFSDDGPEISAGFITSIVENETSNMFGQTNLSHNSDGSKISIGLGYRTLDPTGSSVLGLNAFVDHDFEKEHTRGSVGVEVQNNFISGNSNQYFSLSDYKPKTSRILQKPADGYDARLEMAIPYFPNLFATYRNETWDLDDDGKVRREAIGVKGEIAPNVVLKLENQSSTGNRSNQNIGSLTYTYVPDDHDGNAPIEYRDPITVFDTYKHRFVDRDESMPLASRYINNPPVADDSTLAVAENSTADIDVASLISDPDGDALTVTVADGSVGSTSVSGTVITYTPTRDNPGSSDSFVYTVNDGNGGTDTGTISVTISENNDPPVADDSTLAVAENSTADIDVASLISDPDGDALTVTVADGSVGSTSVSGTVITYTPTGDNPGSSDSFVYTVDDGNAGTDTATITVTISENNDAPVADDSTLAVAENSTADIDVASLISDPDGDALTVTVTDGSVGSTSVSGTVITYTPTGDNPGSSDSFVYTVNDGNGGTDTGTISVTINQAALSACTGNPVNSYDNQGITLTSADIINPATQFYWSGNGHIYEVVTATATWENAQAQAASLSLNGVPGHLATITSQNENTFIESLVSSLDANSWMGASDADLEDCWKWTDGPEAGVLVDDTFSNWHPGHPESGSNFNYLEFSRQGIWFVERGFLDMAYVIEYSGE